MKGCSMNRLADFYSHGRTDVMSYQDMQASAFRLTFGLQHATRAVETSQRKQILGGPRFRADRMQFTVNGGGLGDSRTVSACLRKT